MKYPLLLLFLLLTSFSYSATTNLFTYNPSAVNEKLSGLNNLENYVNQHEGITLDQLQKQNHELLANVTLEESSSFSKMTEGPLGIPSFIWGCVLSWVGILIVYLITQDSEETKKALYGCIAMALTGCILYVAFWIVLVGGTWGSFHWF